MISTVIVFNALLDLRSINLLQTSGPKGVVASGQQSPIGYDSRHLCLIPPRRLRYYDDRLLAWPKTSHWVWREMRCPSSHGHFRPHRICADQKLGPTPGPPRPVTATKVLALHRERTHRQGSRLQPSQPASPAQCSHTIRLSSRVLTVDCPAAPFPRPHPIRRIRSLSFQAFRCLALHREYCGCF